MGPERFDGGLSALATRNSLTRADEPVSLMGVRFIGYSEEVETIREAAADAGNGR